MEKCDHQLASDLLHCRHCDQMCKLLDCAVCKTTRHVFLDELPADGVYRCPRHQAEHERDQLRAEKERLELELGDLLQYAAKAIPESEHPADPTPHNWAWQIGGLGEECRLRGKALDRLESEMKTFRVDYEKLKNEHAAISLERDRLKAHAIELETFKKANKLVRCAEHKRWFPLDGFCPECGENLRAYDGEPVNDELSEMSDDEALTRFVRTATTPWPRRVAAAIRGLRGNLATTRSAKDQAAAEAVRQRDRADAAEAQLVTLVEAVKAVPLGKTAIHPPIYICAMCKIVVARDGSTKEHRPGCPRRVLDGLPEAARKRDAEMVGDILGGVQEAAREATARADAAEANLRAATARAEAAEGIVMEIKAELADRRGRTVRAIQKIIGID